AEARKLDRVEPRQAADTLTYERVGRDGGEQPAFITQAVRPAARRTADFAHSMPPQNQVGVKLITCDGLEYYGSKSGLRHRTCPRTHSARGRVGHDRRRSTDRHLRAACKIDADTPRRECRAA